MGWRKQARGMSLNRTRGLQAGDPRCVAPAHHLSSAAHSPLPCRRESTICQCCDMTCISGLGPRNPDGREDRAIYSCKDSPVASWRGQDNGLQRGFLHRQAQMMGSDLAPTSSLSRHSRTLPYKSNKPDRPLQTPQGPTDCP